MYAFILSPAYDVLNYRNSVSGTMLGPKWQTDEWKMVPDFSESPNLFFFSFRFYLFYFLEKGREGEREGAKHQCVVASHAPPTGDLARNPDMCPDWELNRQPLGSQAGTQSTESHQPEPQAYFWWTYLIFKTEAGKLYAKGYVGTEDRKFTSN